jgi:hypothetical protein
MIYKYMYIYKPCGVATWSFPFWMSQSSSSPYYLITVHSGSSPPPSYAQQLASLPSPSDANLSSGVPVWGEDTDNNDDNNDDNNNENNNNNNNSNDNHKSFDKNIFNTSIL